MIRMILVSGLALAIAACGGSETPPSTPPAKPAAPAAPAGAQATVQTGSATATTQRGPAGAFEVVDVQIGTAVGPDGKIVNPSTKLPKSETIHAVVVTEGRGSDVMLNARWSSAHPTIKNARTQLGNETQTISPDGPAFTKFTITKPGGWPAGSYQIELWGNAGVLIAKEFVVE
jgi:hypothetical protein